MAPDKKFLAEFGFESLRDLSDLEALKDAGLMGAKVPDSKRDAMLLSVDVVADAADGEPEGGCALDRPQPQKASRDRVA